MLNYNLFAIIAFKKTFLLVLGIAITNVLAAPALVALAKAAPEASEPADDDLGSSTVYVHGSYGYDKIKV
ncbi:hypothetical protein QBC43DRAFT_294561 [Cladorrhinum sp. PSN259]|nr:hypothetical protein QBC43DRAFT_294561 [Cladorrhinum sp. PSN259]